MSPIHTEKKAKNGTRSRHARRDASNRIGQKAQEHSSLRKPPARTRESAVTEGVLHVCARVIESPGSLSGRRTGNPY